jgi:hypothetical protein
MPPPEQKKSVHFEESKNLSTKRTTQYHPMVIEKSIPGFKLPIVKSIEIKNQEDQLYFIS